MLHAFLTAVQDMGAAMDAEAAKKIGESVTSGSARQPEAAGSIQTAGIILAALIEGVALFGLVIGLLFKLLA